MKAVKHPGICKICGEFKELTLEHIPPQKAFNSQTVKIASFEEVAKTMLGKEDIMPWDTSGVKGRLQQGGYKKSCLCRACNNNTGQWYMRAYTDFVKTINSMMQIEEFTVGNLYSFILKDVYPLRIFKAMMTMMCDINNDCFGDAELRTFLMDKNSKDYNKEKYSLYMYLVSTQMPRIGAISGVFDLKNQNNSVLVSEISVYPVGFALYLNKPNSYTPLGVSLECFAEYDYDKTLDVHFKEVPYLDINSQFPIDYRSKDEIVKCVENNKDKKAL